MNKNKISLVLLALINMIALCGCVAIKETNIAKLGDEYYIGNITKSDIHRDIKEYLKQNRITIGTIISSSNLPTGSLGNIVLDGVGKSIATQDGTKWGRDIMSMLIISELTGLIVEKAGYVLTYCGDYTHSSIAENGVSGSVEYTYYLSDMTEEQRQSMLKLPMQSDCGLDSYLGNLIFKKKIRVNSSLGNAKLSITEIDKNQPITKLDNVSVILKDMANQASMALLTDAEMLQALKDYRLTGGKKLTVEQPSKTTVTEPITTSPTSNQSVNLDNFKTQCKELGFKVGTADYGNCVLQLMK
jgi:hypothetical protein